MRYTGHQSEAPRSPAEIDWKSDSSITGFIQRALGWRDLDMRHAVEQGTLNTQWYLGYQDTFWDPELRQMVRQANPDGRVRLVYNQLRPAIETALAKMAMPMPMRVVPTTDDPRDTEAAELQNMVAQHYHRKLGFDRLREQADVSAILLGGVFAKVTWDPTLGDPLGVRPADVGLSESEFRATFGDMLAERQGDVRVDLLTLNHVYWGPRGVQFEAAEWVIELHETSRTSVADRFGLPIEEVPCAYDGEERLIVRPTATGPDGSPEYVTDRDTVRVCVLWVKPSSSLHPHGRHVVCLNEHKVLRKGPLPYRHESIPIVYWPYDIMDGQTVGTTPVTNALPPQADLNQAVSNIAEICESHARPMMFIQEDGLVDPSELSNRIGGAFRVRPGFKEPWTQPGIPVSPSLSRRIEAAMRQIQDLLAAPDIMQGRLPSSQVRSGLAVDLLQEPANRRHERRLAARARWFQDIMRLVLSTTEQYVSEQRLISILGDDSRWRTTAYTGSRLRLSRREAVDISVENDGMVHSRASTMSMVNTLLQAQILSPTVPAEKAYVLKTLNMGYARPAFNPRAAAEETQKGEIELMRRAEAPVHMLQDHDAHIAVLQSYIETTGFAQETAASEQGRAFGERVMQHYVAHLAARAQRAAMENGITQRVGQQVLGAFNGDARSVASRSPAGAMT